MDDDDGKKYFDLRVCIPYSVKFQMSVSFHLCRFENRPSGSDVWVLGS
jgi:hypothetical protein